MHAFLLVFLGLLSFPILAQYQGKPEDLDIMDSEKLTGEQLADPRYRKRLFALLRQYRSSGTEISPVVIALNKGPRLSKDEIKSLVDDFPSYHNHAQGLVAGYLIYRDGSAEDVRKIMQTTKNHDGPNDKGFAITAAAKSPAYVGMRNDLLDMLEKWRSNKDVSDHIVARLSIDGAPDMTSRLLDINTVASSDLLIQALMAKGSKKVLRERLLHSISPRATGSESLRGCYLLRDLCAWGASAAKPNDAERICVAEIYPALKKRVEELKSQETKRSEALANLDECQRGVRASYPNIHEAQMRYVELHDEKGKPYSQQHRENLDF